MKLYYHPVSTTSRPIMLFAADNRVELEYQLVDIVAGEHVQPAFASINPNQAVPVLDDDGFRLTESSAILKYLADRVGSRAYPIDPRQRARVNERMDWFNTGLSRELCYGFIYPQLFPNHQRPDGHAQQQTLAWGRTNALRWLQVLDERWIGPYNDYVCGNQITIADYFGIASVTLGEAAHIDFSAWPNISRWIARMKDRPAWSVANDAFYTYLVKPYVNASFESLSLQARAA
ncbi:glutathione S-transferase [Povalibacter uvarum]|uniref:Glutathione S-transferase n=1 Tax=Povalibacter uvarum TaxID=732238 RepID=A0A841HI71_9GAMM|nr:glutathione S-transferase family protein [Povalibacter uvarum]MBB6092496.1 glutathione S-transferase [Povalibacter uvarum]